MPTRIRLQRHGRKGIAFYHIVIADGRAPRDGRFIEKIGTYNPLSKPAEIQLDFDRALYWMQAGAQPSDTTRSLLANKGVLYMYHLLKGVKKNALTLEQAEERFKQWNDEKIARLQSQIKDEILKTKELSKKRVAAETIVKEKRGVVLAKKYAKPIPLKESTPEDSAT